jgi:outer membrane receptor protein involved in Fe transport
VRIPITSPTWNVPYVLYNLEFDIAEREEWYASSVLGVPGDGLNVSKRSQSNTQRPKFSIRWNPFDDSLTLRASYSEAFHVPYLNELSPQGAETFPASTVNSTGGSYQLRGLAGGNPSLRPEVAYDYSYGAVWTPKYFVKGLTLAAEYWHVHERDLVSPFSFNYIASHCGSFPGRVLFESGSTCSTVPGDRVVEVNNQSFNLGSVVTEGFDFELSQIVDTAQFGHGDFGTLTATANATYVTRFVFMVRPNTGTMVDPNNPPTLIRHNNDEVNLAGDFADFGSLPHWRGYANLFWNGPKATWMQGLELGTTAHYVGQYNDSELTAINLHEFLNGLHEGGGGPNSPGAYRKIREWLTIDLQVGYTFNLPPPAPAGEVAGLSKDGGKSVKMGDGKDKNVMPVSTAEYNPCGWRAWLNQTSLTVGMNNIMDLDPPYAAGSFENKYDEATADVKGRFWYVSLVKKF